MATNVNHRIQSRVRWTPEERKTVHKHAAILMIDQGLEGYGMAVFQAQKVCLKPSRQRSKLSALSESTSGHRESIREAATKILKHRWSKGVSSDAGDKYLKRHPDIDALVRAHRPSTDAEVVKTEQRLEQVNGDIQKMESEMGIQAGTQIVAEASLREALETIQPLPVKTDETMKVFRDSLENFVRDFAIEVGKAMVPHIREAAISAIQLVKKEVSATGLEPPKAIAVSAVNPEPTAFKEKVGYIGGGQKRSDLNIASEGLDDVYSFYFVDSLAKVGALMNCEVVVQSKYCSHSLLNAAKRMNPNAVWIHNKTPNEVNELLLERFVNSENTRKPGKESS